MSEHGGTRKPSTAQVPLVLVRAKEAYQSWHSYLVNLKRLDRYTIGAKIDDTFLSVLELIFRACFACDKFEKLSLVSQVIGKTDLLKFFIQIGWEHKIINHTQYGVLILYFDEVGRMLGGWKKAINEKTPANK
ncbi:MAG: four helix bundle protein [bacterium]|nr:four helix bundle protein [bacterium]